MDKAVTDTHCLLGSRLRDPDSGRQGRIVGIDQSRETPALLVRWGEAGVERVALTVTELSELVAASLAHERARRDEEAARTASRPVTRDRRDRQETPSRRARGEAPAEADTPGATGYRPLATGSGGRR